MGNLRADLVEMHLHGFGVGKGHHEGSPCASRRTDGTEQVGAFVALVGGQSGAGACFGPDTHPAVLLPEPCFILEPQLDGLFLRHTGDV